jgi:hypothetical protein
MAQDQRHNVCGVGGTYQLTHTGNIGADSTTTFVGKGALAKV